MSKTKYIFVTGGVTSSLGKGIIAASLGKLLKDRGFRVAIQKFDPYLNIDPGTLNPYEHGECYVTDDGAETDLDLGHYERFLDVPTSQANNVTTGRIYHNVITNERKGEYLGRTVQVVPHITDEIKRNFFLLSKDDQYDIIITEIGGCVGDIESLPFIEALRQAKWEIGSQNVVVIHLTLIPYLKAAGELKTKPTQHSVKKLSEDGVQPDVLVCRSEHHLPPDIRKKIALFCNVEPRAVIEAQDAKSIYHVPLKMRQEKLDEIVLRRLGLPIGIEPEDTSWEIFIEKLSNPHHTVSIALVGKYVELPDAYKSIIESFIHAGAHLQIKVDLKLIHSEEVNYANVSNVLAGVHGVLVAPGFGERGFAGKLAAVRYARERKIPFFGICLGMQAAVVEFAQNVLCLQGASTRELYPNAQHPVIDLMESQKHVKNMGGTMRLGAFNCRLSEGSNAEIAYGVKDIKERHRHRYEFNDAYRDQFEAAGMRATGINPESGLVEIVEIADHPWFVGTQFHPELKSRALKPHPLFMSFVQASLKLTLVNS